MRYFDPDRPRINGYPAYVDLKVNPLAPMPSLSVDPCADDEDSVYLTVHLLMPDRGFAAHYATISANYLPAFWQEWLHDVEGTLKHYFKYEPPTTKTKAREMTLDDLLGENDAN